MTELAEAGAGTDAATSTKDSGWAARYRHRTAWTLGCVAVAVALFAGYLRIARTQPINSDGASNALQAWDLLHGNWLLRGWTVSDVSFYSTELIQYALVELVRGLDADVIRVAAAMTYTLLVICAAVVAKGRTTGRAGWLRAALAVAILLVPQPGTGYLTLLSSPDHTGTGVPLLVAWFVLDRVTERDRRLPYLIAVLLAWGEIGDPLVAVLGGLPLIVVSAVRMWRDRRSHRWRGLDARLLAAGLGSVVLAQGFVLLVRLAGGFGTHPPTMQFTRLGDLAGHLRITVTALAIDFGAYLPERQGAAAVAVGVLHIAGILAVLAATGTVLYGLIRPGDRAPGDRVLGDRAGGDRAGGDRAGGDRVNEVLALSILANLVAFVFSTQPVDRLSAREVVAVLPLGAVLAGRVYGERLRALPARVLGAALALVLAVTFAVQVAAPPVPVRDQVADWLDARGLRYGLGGYWLASSTTLLSRGRVTVVPVSGEQHILSYRWESYVDWYDPTKHDARFLVLDTRDPTYGTVAAAIAQLGAPATRYDIGPYAVLVYDHNLLIGLPAQCDGRIAPSMAACVGR